MTTIQDFINTYYTPGEIYLFGFINRQPTNKYMKNGWFWTKQLKDTSFEKIEKLNYYNKCIYLSLNVFDGTLTEKGNISRAESAVKEIKSIFFDIDKKGPEIKEKVIAELGDPTFEIQTSEKKYQLIYQFEKNITEDFAFIKNISYTLTKYFQTDNTFDLPRIFRAPFYKNQKPGNGFDVKVKYNEKYFKKEYFLEYLQKNNIELLDSEVEKKKPKPVKITATKPETVKTKDNIYENINFNPKNKYYEKYLEQVKNCNNDKSRADITFVRFLMYRKMSFENAIKNLKECREDLIQKHRHEINHYISNLENSVSDIR